MIIGKVRIYYNYRCLRICNTGGRVCDDMDDLTSYVGNVNEYELVEKQSIQHLMVVFIKRDDTRYSYEKYGI